MRIMLILTRSPTFLSRTIWKTLYGIYVWQKPCRVCTIFSNTKPFVDMLLSTVFLLKLCKGRDSYRRTHKICMRMLIRVSRESDKVNRFLYAVFHRIAQTRWFGFSLMEAENNKLYYYCCLSLRTHRVDYRRGKSQHCCFRAYIQ